MVDLVAVSRMWATLAAQSTFLTLPWTILKLGDLRAEISWNRVHDSAANFSQNKDFGVPMRWSGPSVLVADSCYLCISN